MGFKFKKFTIVGGSEELPVGAGYTTVRPNVLMGITISSLVGIQTTIHWSGNRR